MRESKMQTREQRFTELALRALNDCQGSELKDHQTLCQNMVAWLTQSGLAASMDALARYQHKSVSRWLVKSYEELLLASSYQPKGTLRTWALDLESLDNLTVTRELIDFTHTLTRLVRLKVKDLL